MTALMAMPRVPRRGAAGPSDPSRGELLDLFGALCRYLTVRRFEGSSAILRQRTDLQARLDRLTPTADRVLRECRARIHPAGVGDGVPFLARRAIELLERTGEPALGLPPLRRNAPAAPAAGFVKE